MKNSIKTHSKKQKDAMKENGKTAGVRQKKRMKLDAAVIASILLVTALVILVVSNLPYNKYSTGMTGATVTYEIAKVTAILSESLQDSELQKGLMTGSQTLKAELLSGKHKGETVEVSNALSTYNSVLVKAGKYVIVIVDELDSGEYQVRVYNYFRAPLILLMAMLFFGALILIGRKKGLMSGFGLIYTFVCVLLIFLPLILRGHSPIFAAILLVIMVTSATMIFLNGATKKSLCAIAGTVSGVILSGLILFAFGELMHISGYSTDEAESLILIGQTTGLQVRNLLFSGILIASLGAVMDVAISIVSAIYEFHVHMPGVKTGELMRSGMNVGKDMIGTMSNTLILAFTGTSLNLLILLYSYSVQFNQFLNMNTIGIEILQALAGSLGVILTVPITAAVTAKMLVRENR